MGNCLRAQPEQADSPHRPDKPASVGQPGPPNMPAVTQEDRLKAETIKTQGNQLFRRGKYAAAIDMYTEAVLHDPEMHVLYVNRALCYRKLSKWQQCESDARTAIELHRMQIKAYYLLGVALRHTDEFAEACKHLERALDAAIKEQDVIKDEIWRELAACKYAQWQHSAEARRVERASFRRRLQAFMDSHFAAHPDDLGREKDEVVVKRLMYDLQEQDAADEADHVYTCTLTMEPFRDPVVTPDGNSFERTALLDHLRKVGEFEPLTRNPLTVEDLIPNQRLRMATQQYLDQHPWAWGECIETSY
eukprot:jgi/Ulvmu1/9044/UM005_0137.1